MVGSEHAKAALDALDGCALACGIAKAQRVLVRHLKVGKPTLSVVQYAGGRLEEVRDEAIPAIEGPEPVKAVTVQRPTIGCPSPDFGQADVRATEVLTAFLSAEQAEDWRRFNRFIMQGADTGRRYLISSRKSPSYGTFHRSLY